MVSKQLEEAREFYENDLYEFAKYLNPNYVYGEIHETVFRWLQEEGTSSKQLLLLPRGHLKSHCIQFGLCGLSHGNLGARSSMYRQGKNWLKPRCMLLRTC